MTTTTDQAGNLNDCIGQFVHAETGFLFFYAEGGCPWMTEEFIGENEITHTIEINRKMGEYRAARILKTVAYVLVDEDENGLVWEKWSIKRHTEYLHYQGTGKVAC